MNFERDELMTRDEALSAVKEHVKNPNLVKHMLATEAIMRALARRFGENEDEWALAGLLHDIDVEITADDFSSHGRVGSDMARDLGASEDICRAILCHNEVHGVPCRTLMEKALFCSDPLTGLITAGALIRPDRKLEGLTTKSIMKRFNEKRFAAGANREQILTCTGIGLDLKDFIGTGIQAMQGISDDLGL